MNGTNQFSSFFLLNTGWFKSRVHHLYSLVLNQNLFLRDFRVSRIDYSARIFNTKSRLFGAARWKRCTFWRKDQPLKRASSSNIDTSHSNYYSPISVFPDTDCKIFSINFLCPSVHFTFNISQIVAECITKCQSRPF